MDEWHTLILCLDSKLGEKRKEGREEEGKGGKRKGGNEREKTPVVCIGRKSKEKKGISFSFQIFSLMERFGCLQNEGDLISLNPFPPNPLPPFFLFKQGDLHPSKSFPFFSLYLPPSKQGLGDRIRNEDIRKGLGIANIEEKMKENCLR